MQSRLRIGASVRGTVHWQHSDHKMLLLKGTARDLAVEICDLLRQSLGQEACSVVVMSDRTERIETAVLGKVA